MQRLSHAPARLSWASLQLFQAALANVQVRTIPHPLYDPSTASYDLGLLVLSEPITTIKPVQLAPAGLVGASARCQARLLACLLACVLACLSLQSVSQPETLRLAMLCLLCVRLESACSDT